MSNSGNIHFNGGSQQQQAFIMQAHQTAVSMVQHAQQAAKMGGVPFTTWFGSSSMDVVASRFEEITYTLNTGLFFYDLTQMLSYQVENELVFILNELILDRTTGIRLTVFPWKGIFLQTSLQTISRQASLSIIHLVASAFENWTDLVTVQDRDGAQLLARWDSENAMVSPRNYMYFVDAISP